MAGAMNGAAGTATAEPVTEEAAIEELVLSSETEVRELVLRVADGIYDPCGMALGTKIGLAEMGLLKEVRVEPAGDGWSVGVRIRLTSPGCQYYFMFRDVMEERLEAHPQIHETGITWDETLDWTPEDLAPAARERLAERRQSLRSP